MKLVAINGSPRSGGNTEALLEAVMQPVQAAGIETQMIQIGGKGIRGCMACYTCGKRKDRKCSQQSDMLNECLEKVLEADEGDQAARLYVQRCEIMEKEGVPDGWEGVTDLLE